MGGRKSRYIEVNVNYSIDLVTRQKTCAMAISVTVATGFLPQAGTIKVQTRIHTYILVNPYVKLHHHFPTQSLGNTF
jgi:hypothetical protein